jgi:hypothetical protein
MRVGFTDPQGSMMWRVLPFLGPIATFFFACFGPLEGSSAWMTAFLSLGAINFLAAMSFRQRKARTVELEVQPGYVRVKKAGTRNQVIRARDIVGATTTRTREGLILTLQHALRDQPITLQVKDDAEADAVRAALGIGHSGYGTIAWRSIPSGSMKGLVVSGIISALAFLACVLFGAAGSVGGSVLAGMLAFSAMAVAFFSWLGRETTPSIVMTADGLGLHTANGWFRVPYDWIQQVTDQGEALRFTVPAPYYTVGVRCGGPAFGALSAEDKQVIIKQIEAAGQRARGLGPHKNDASARVDILRRNGQTPRDWLMRLDMQGQMLSDGSGYRGNTLDAEDLWAILEDPEAEPELRSAAARVLRHSTHATARPRIEAAVAAVREDGTNKRLRISLRDDVDAASQELATLEAEEMQAEFMRSIQQRAFRQY